MSFTYDNDIGADPLVVIKTKKRKRGTKINFIPIGKEDEINENDFTSMSLKNEGEEFQVIPNTNKERQIGYITGQSGSGKTTWVINYCNEYKKAFPDNPIYLFSSIGNEGEADPYNKLGVDRINISDALDELNAKDFDNCLVIFDDMDCYKDKKVLKKIEILRDGMLETGRHNKTYVLITYHLPTNGFDTRRMINEASFVVYFPLLSNEKIKNLLKNYLGLEDPLIKYIKRTKSRWCCVMRTLPNVIVLQKEIRLVDMED